MCQAAARGQKTKTQAPPGLLPKHQGQLRGFPFIVSGHQAAAGQPWEQTHSPKSEFQFSSATRRVHISPSSRGRVVRTSKSPRAAAAHVGVGEGSPHAAVHIQEKKKPRENLGLQKPMPRAIYYWVQTTPGRSLQGVSNPQI